jgi:hypothetical protein
MNWLLTLRMAFSRLGLFRECSRRRMEKTYSILTMNDSIPDSGLINGVGRFNGGVRAIERWFLVLTHDVL